MPGSTTQDAPDSMLGQRQFTDQGEDIRQSELTLADPLHLIVTMYRHSYPLVLPLRLPLAEATAARTSAVTGIILYLHFTSSRPYLP